jgi:hypothetical protein
MCTIHNIKELVATYKAELKSHILQDIDIAEEVLAELGYEKKKAPTPVMESRPDQYQQYPNGIVGVWYG